MMMKRKIFVSVFVLLAFGASCFAQNAVQIKKKSSFKIPGMPMIPGTEQLENRPAVVYIKGARMRTDTTYKKRKLTGGKETVTQTGIQQCDKQRLITFNDKKKKYFLEPMSGQTSDNVKNARKGGAVTMVGSVTDTGERAKLFGYEAKHLKQSYTITPGRDACQKETLKVEIDGWYIDLPEFSCPIRRKPREFQMDSKCFDEVDFQMKGAVSGVPVKEIQTMTFQGMTLIIEEEAIELTKTNLDDAFFEPPTNYKAANTLKEVEDDSEDSSASDNQTSEQIPAETTSVSQTPTLSLPPGGVERAALGAKKAGVTRIGIVKPAVKLPDKDTAEMASEIAEAAAALVSEKLKKPMVEAVEVTSESEAKTFDCDYVITVFITQKKSGGGLFGKIIPMPTMPGRVKTPQPRNGQTMTRLELLLISIVKAKDEWTFEYKMTNAGGENISQAATKAKAEQYGEDVLSPQIKEAAAAIQGKIKK